MELTVFLSQLWGPAILAVAVGMFLNRSHYAKIYRNLENGGLAALTFGMIAMVLGTAQLLAHNVYGTFAQGVISLLGWALVAKGAAFLIFPRLADRGGDWVISAKILTPVSILMLVAGVYLTYVGYFA